MWGQQPGLQVSSCEWTSPVGWFDSKPSLFIVDLSFFPGWWGPGTRSPPLGSEPRAGGPQGVPPCTPGESAAAERREGQVTCASGYMGALPTSSAKPQSRKALSELYKRLYLIICFIISRLEPGYFSFRSSRWSCAFPTALIE